MRMRKSARSDGRMYTRPSAPMPKWRSHSLTASVGARPPAAHVPRDHDKVVAQTMHFHKFHSFCTPLASGDIAVSAYYAVSIPGCAGKSIESNPSIVCTLSESKQAWSRKTCQIACQIRTRRDERAAVCDAPPLAAAGRCRARCRCPSRTSGCRRRRTRATNRGNRDGTVLKIGCSGIDVEHRQHQRERGEHGQHQIAVLQQVAVENRARAAAVEHMDELGHDERGESDRLRLDELIAARFRSVSRTRPSVHRPISKPRLMIFQPSRRAKMFSLRRTRLLLHQILLGLDRRRAPSPAARR